MGVLTIDAVIGTRFDDLTDVILEFYFRGMTLASDIQKSPARLAKERVSEIDPPLGKLT
jgi:hypothetical protein